MLKICRSRTLPWTHDYFFRYFINYTYTSHYHVITNYSITLLPSKAVALSLFYLKSLHSLAFFQAALQRVICRTPKIGHTPTMYDQKLDYETVGMIGHPTHFSTCGISLHAKVSPYVTNFSYLDILHFSPISIKGQAYWGSP